MRAARPLKITVFLYFHRRVPDTRLSTSKLQQTTPAVFAAVELIVEMQSKESNRVANVKTERALFDRPHSLFHVNHTHVLEHQGLGIR